MAFPSDAASHVDSGDGSSCKEILQTQQTSVRFVAADSDAVRTGWLLGIFSDTISVKRP